MIAAAYAGEESPGFIGQGSRKPTGGVTKRVSEQG
jgi:hypothetical protein